jgi:Kef-type K+ transport system membrane component KefB
VTANKKIGAAIALIMAIAAAVGLVIGFFNIQPAVGLAIVGIVIGTGVARGAFSSTPDGVKRN